MKSSFFRYAGHARVLLENKVKWACQREIDRFRPTYERSAAQSTAELESYLTPIPLPKLKPLARQIAAVTRHFINHRFDLLGSGWVTVRHGMTCAGVEGQCYSPGPEVTADPQGHWLAGRLPKANLSYAQTVWQAIGAGDAQDPPASAYAPIDWQIDFKSGYRWSEKTWYKDIVFGRHAGVDIKVPWELARSQHMVQFALAYTLAAHGSASGRQPDGRDTNPDHFEPQLQQASVYQSEFRRQVLDFIATNPPRYGVNWNCAMDVAIRAVNWLVTLDLFQSCGAWFDADFLTIFNRSIYDHGQHIFNNLEWYPDFRGNHYLANIAGLLYVGAYLKGNGETDAWLAFAVQEWLKERDYQFNPDGSNFEGATAYHRLSSEMMVYSAALILGLTDAKKKALKVCKPLRRHRRPGLESAPLRFFKFPGRDRESPLPPDFFEGLQRAAGFTQDITKPNRHIVQIGDNDSGRFLKLQPVFHEIKVSDAVAKYKNLAGYEGLSPDEIYWDEVHLDHRHLVAAINGLTPRPAFSEFTGDQWIETGLIRTLAFGNHLIGGSETTDGNDRSDRYIGTDSDWDQFHTEVNGWPNLSIQQYHIPFGKGDALDGLRCRSYPDFGLYIVMNEAIYIAMRCGPVGYHGLGCHSHNDQLSLEVFLDGKEVIVDPGTYLYTPLPEQRNRYRSVHAHCAPAPLREREPASLEQDLFLLKGAAAGRCIYFGPKGFIGMHNGYGQPVYRVVGLRTDGVAITDYSQYLALTRDAALETGHSVKIPYSPGYGICQN
ncbi:MAG: heparinase II/III family protein [Pseudomonadota bacterium]